MGCRADLARRQVADHLRGRLKCKVRPHRLGIEVVSLTDGSASSVRIFLSAAKLFYRVMYESRMYPDKNPLVQLTVLDQAGTNDEFAPMPERSGVAPPRHRRLSDSYFRLEGADWVPRVIDDPRFPALILMAGKQVSGWALRETCVTRLLFESGARISEVVGLTLADWMTRGTRQEATAFSKGSHGRRTKFLRFSSDTAKLLRRYFDTERRAVDHTHRGLAEYARLAELGALDARAVPVFLTQQQTPLSSKHYRDHYWSRACAAAELAADVHQARHWYVTAAVRAIYESHGADGPEVKRRMRELIEYMRWRRGWQTIEAYEHYFDASRHAEVQDQVHASLEAALRRALKGNKSARRSEPLPLARAAPAAGPMVPRPADELALLEDLLR
jgi:integrase